MKKFEAGIYKTFVGNIKTTYTIEKISKSFVTVTFHKGGKYEITKKCKVIDCGSFQYCYFKGIILESTDYKIA